MPETYTTAAEAIDRLLAAQMVVRNSRRLKAAMRASRLPYLRTLTDFAGVNWLSQSVQTWIPALA